MRKEFNFEKLEVYQKAIEYIDKVYLVTKDFPKVEMYGVVNQLRRSATSIALNISEGFGRYHKNSKKQFYYIAGGSVYESIPLLKISLNQDYLDQGKFEELYSDCSELSKMISGLLKSIDKRIS
jgi:four helix bundle protein